MTIRVADLAQAMKVCERTARTLLYELACSGWVQVRQTGRANLFAAIVAPSEHIETGKCGQIRSAKSARSDRQKAQGQIGKKRKVAPFPPPAYTLSPPPCKQQIKGRGEEREATPPPPPEARLFGAETDTATAAPGAIPDGVEQLARTFRAKQSRREGLREILGVVIEDLRLKRYARADLQLVIESESVFDMKAFRLRERVPEWASNLRRETFLARLRDLDRDKVAVAWRRSTPSVKARVERIDLVAEELVLVEYGPTGIGDRRVVATGRDLEPWAFGPEDPTLIPLGESRVAPRPNAIQSSEVDACMLKGRWTMNATQVDLSLPQDPVLRAIAERVAAIVEPRRYRACFNEVIWSATDKEISLEFSTATGRDYAEKFAQAVRIAAREVLGADRAVVLRARATATKRVTE
jgi:hypothetical protein